MKIVSVIPLSRGLNKDSLTYFTSKQVFPGSFVTVPLRNKEVPAIVIGVEDALRSKGAIKGASYGIKKITKVHGGRLFLGAFMRAAERTAVYFASTTGAVLEALTPQSILKDFLMKDTKKKDTPHKDAIRETHHEKFIFQADEEERIASYKSFIRESFAQQKSIYLCLPTIEDIERTAPSLSRGIEEYVSIFHSGLTKKVLRETWSDALSGDHPKLLIGTAKFLSIPRDDIGAIIIERENSNSYMTRRRPFIDLRKFAEFYAEELGIKLIYGDILLRTETLYRKESEDFIEFAPLKFRSLTSVQQKIIDMKKYTTLTGRKKFVLIGEEVERAMGSALKNNESFFLLTSRRGLFPITVCSDCGDTVRCDTCSSPLVLHTKKVSSPMIKKGVKNTYLCHSCGEESASKDLCKGCGGWRLTTLGIGSERVEEEVKALFPDVTILRLDKDIASTKNKAHEIIKKFYASPNNILIGTKMAIPYLHRKVDNAAVISIDSLFTIPDFRIHEQIFSLLLRLRAKVVKKFFIQTRLESTSLFKNVIEGNLLNFYRDEIEGRKRFNYPPFSILIKISRSGKKYTVEKDMEKLEKFLKDYNPTIFPAFSSGAQGIFIKHALIRVDRSAWPNDTIRELLGKLPPSFTVKVDPEDIL